MTNFATPQNEIKNILREKSFLLIGQEGPSAYLIFPEDPQVRRKIEKYIHTHFGVEVKTARNSSMKWGIGPDLGEMTFVLGINPAMPSRDITPDIIEKNKKIVAALKEIIGPKNTAEIVDDKGQSQKHALSQLNRFRQKMADSQRSAI